MKLGASDVGRGKTIRHELTVTLITKFGIIATSVLTQSLLAYLLQPSARGAYAVIVVFATLFGLFVSFSADRGAQYLVVANRMSISQGTIFAIIFGIFMSVIGVALATPLVNSDISFFQQANPRSFYLGMGLIPIIVLGNIVDLQLAGQRRFLRLGIFTILRAAITLIAMTVILLWLGYGVNGAIVSLVAGNMVFIFIGLWDLRKHCGLRWEIPSKPNSLNALGYGLKYHLARIGDKIEPRIGVVLLSMVGTRDEIGLFSVASIMMFRFNIISNATGTVLFPRVVGQHPGRRPDLIARAVRLVGMATAVALAVLLLLSTPIVRILFSESFLQIVPLIQIAALGTFVYTSSEMFITYFLGTNRPIICSWSVWIGLLANVVSFFLLFWLSPITGLQSAAWAMTVGMMCRGVFLAVMFHRSTRMSLVATWLPQRRDFIYVRSTLRSGVRLLRNRS